MNAPWSPDDDLELQSIHKNFCSFFFARLPKINFRLISPSNAIAEHFYFRCSCSLDTRSSVSGCDSSIKYLKSKKKPMDGSRHIDGKLSWLVFECKVEVNCRSMSVSVWKPYRVLMRIYASMGTTTLCPWTFPPHLASHRVLRKCHLELFADLFVKRDAKQSKWMTLKKANGTNEKCNKTIIVDFMSFSWRWCCWRWRDAFMIQQ